MVITMQIRSDISPVVLTVISSLVPILSNTEVSVSLTAFRFDKGNFDVRDDNVVLASVASQRT